MQKTNLNKYRNSHLPVILTLLVSNFFNLANAQTTPGSLETYSTIHSIGVEWDISGDTNHNAVCLVQYRVNDNSDWSDAQPLFRVDFEGYEPGF